MSDNKLSMHANPSLQTALPKAALDDMNWIRGLAAIAVLIGHIRGLFFVDYESVRGSMPMKLLYMLTGLGHQAVIVFFVLSGFFIGASVVTSSSSGRWSWSRFGLRRFTRLYVVLIPALVLTAAWDLAGMGLFGTAGIYSGSIQARHLDLPNVTETLSLPLLLGNLAFLQHIFVTSFGSNGPLWSLSYEFWSYLTFPLVFRAFVSSEKTGARVGYAVAAGLLFLVGGFDFRFYFGIWALGAVLAYIWTRRPFRFGHPVITLGAIGIFSVTLLVARGKLLAARHLEDVLLGLGTVLLLFVLLARGEKAESRRTGRIAAAYQRGGDVLAGFSYTLYVAHYPVLTFLQAWIVGPTRWQPELRLLGFAAFLCVLIVVVYVYPLARITEGRTDRARHLLERLLGRTQRLRSA
jgi:peptidoglycan/LPS O-acetylase OafA/YrhL